MPNLTQLRSFSMVCLHGSTVRAAELLHRSQSQVSADLRAVEKGMGLALFMRQNGRLQPTSMAAHVHERVLALFESYEALMALTSKGGAGSLSIGATRSLSMTVLPALVRELRKQDPTRSVTVRFHSYPELIDAVAEGRLDQAIVKLPLDDERVRHVDLGEAPLVVVMRRDDPLSKLAQVGASDIGLRNLVRTGSNSPAWRAVQAAFAGAGLQPTSDVAMEGIGPICRMVAQGEGVAVVNHMLASGYLTELDLVWRPFLPHYTEKFALIGHRVLAHRAALEATARMIRKLVEL